LGDGLALLSISTEEKAYLGLKRVSLAICVELGKEWILFEFLQDKIGVEDWVKQSPQGCLSDADHAFDGQIHEIHSREQE
jgi:hypothetical protein